MLIVLNISHQESLEAWHSWETWRFAPWKYVCNQYGVLVLRYDEHFSTFHILDPIPNNTVERREVRQLQCILLQHFDGVVYKEGLITTNVAKVDPILVLF